MECCYPNECGGYTVAPMLIPPCCNKKYCAEEPPCYPRLPRCQRPVYYCCEPKPAKPPKPVYYCCHEMKPSPEPAYECCDSPPKKECCAPPCEGPCSPQCHKSCCSPCKPVKTKYIMPCYRYEDGRITNQPTVLMRRACEVACGTRKRKPFVLSSYAADPHNEIRQYHSEDERGNQLEADGESKSNKGNCCFHYERKKPTQCDKCWTPCQPNATWKGTSQCAGCQYMDCVYSQPSNLPGYYY